jgi:Putative transposase/Transposase zinc-binding domain
MAVRPALEVADIFRHHGEAFRRGHDGHLGRVERRVMAAIEACRTPVLGGHVEQCGDCGLVRCAYNSCRNRHCPKCQGMARAEWLEARQAELLPVPYFHVVFTLPTAAAEIAFQNKRVVYAILFQAAAEALRTVAADSRHLGAEIGAIAVLHTWGQTLQYHPHLHCIVPGGGLSPDGARWVACRPGFFLPVRVLSQRFRDLFVARLVAAYAAGELRFSGTLAALTEPDIFAERLDALRGIDWVVYAKPPFAGPVPVLAYLGRYTHRVAIANSRLTRLADGQVDFNWKDYRHHGKTKMMTLSADEFIRRFLLHTIPDGFHRIRHFGFLANGHRTAKLALCRTLLAVPPSEPSPRLSLRERYQQLTGEALDACPACGGHMLELGPLPRHPARPHAPFWCDSS